MAATSKIRIKMGQIEVEYEGSDSFLKQELKELLGAVSKLHSESNCDAAVGGEDDLKRKSASVGKTPILTTGAIAAKLNVRTGNGKGLVTAAAAHLTLVKRQETFSRQELLAAAKTAKQYFKTSITNNLSSTLASMVRDDLLVESEADVFALSAKKLADLETALAP